MIKIIIIKKNFLNQQATYQAYLSSIPNNNHYVLTEEIPVLATLSGKEIHVWAKGEDFPYPPDENPHQIASENLFLEEDMFHPGSGSLQEIHIYHQGIHFSKGKADVLKATSGTPARTNYSKSDRRPECVRENETKLALKIWLN